MGVPETDLPPLVLEMVAASPAVVDRAAPGLIEGLYLSGSVALADFRAEVSAIDVVADTGAPCDAAMSPPCNASLTRWLPGTAALSSTGSM